MQNHCLIQKEYFTLPTYQQCIYFNYFLKCPVSTTPWSLLVTCTVCTTVQLVYLMSSELSPSLFICSYRINLSLHKLACLFSRAGNLSLYTIRRWSYIFVFLIWMLSHTMHSNVWSPQWITVQSCALFCHFVQLSNVAVKHRRNDYSKQKTHP